MGNVQKQPLSDPENPNVIENKDTSEVLNAKYIDPEKATITHQTSNEEENPVIRTNIVEYRRESMPLQLNIFQDTKNLKSSQSISSIYSLQDQINQALANSNAKHLVRRKTEEALTANEANENTETNRVHVQDTSAWANEKGAGRLSIKHTKPHRLSPLPKDKQKSIETQTFRSNFILYVEPVDITAESELIRTNKLYSRHNHLPPLHEQAKVSSKKLKYFHKQKSRTRLQEVYGNYKKSDHTPSNVNDQNYLKIDQSTLEEKTRPNTSVSWITLESSKPPTPKITKKKRKRRKKKQFYLWKQTKSGLTAKEIEFFKRLKTVYLEEYLRTFPRLTIPRPQTNLAYFLRCYKNTGRKAPHINMKAKESLTEEIMSTERLNKESNQILETQADTVYEALVSHFQVKEISIEEEVVLKDIIKSSLMEYKGNNEEEFANILFNKILSSELAENQNGFLKDIKTTFIKEELKNNNSLKNKKCLKIKYNRAFKLRKAFIWKYLVRKKADRDIKNNINSYSVT